VSNASPDGEAHPEVIVQDAIFRQLPFLIAGNAVEQGMRAFLQVAPTSMGQPLPPIGVPASLFPTQPIVFTEVGWPSAGGGTLEDQSDFVSALPRLMRTVRPALVI
jgi:hypothetical protein